MELIKILAAILVLIPTLAYAQSAPTIPTDPQQVQTLLERTGCSAEVTAASQTIAAQQKRINELEAQLKDPPKKK